MAESQKAKHSRVILTGGAKDHLNNAMYKGKQLKEYGYWMQDKDEEVIVDLLHPEGIRGIDDNYANWAKRSFQGYHAHIYSTLRGLFPGSPERDKWEWMAEFFNRTIESHSINRSPIKELPFAEYSDQDCSSKKLKYQ